MRSYDYGEPITKTLTGKNSLWTGATADQILLNETLCLYRLRHTRGFPQLEATDWNTHSITMTYTGRTLHWYWKRGIRPTVYNPLDQLNRLYDSLTDANILHLDLHPSGKNITLHEGELHIIDFGIAVRDCKPVSERTHRLMTQFLDQGGYEHSIHETLSRIYANCHVKHGGDIR